MVPEHRFAEEVDNALAPPEDLDLLGDGKGVAPQGEIGARGKIVVHTENPVHNPAVP